MHSGLQCCTHRPKLHIHVHNMQSLHAIYTGTCMVAQKLAYFGLKISSRWRRSLHRLLIHIFISKLIDNGVLWMELYVLRLRKCSPTPKVEHVTQLYNKGGGAAIGKIFGCLAKMSQSSARKKGYLYKLPVKGLMRVDH